MERCKHFVPVEKWNENIARVIKAKLHVTWSPEQIIGRLCQEDHTMLCLKPSIVGCIAGVWEVARSLSFGQKGKRRKSIEERGKFTVGQSISKNPEQVGTRQIFGHWELDTLVSGRGRSKDYVAKFLERKTRLYTAILVPDHTAVSMEKAFGVVASSYPQGIFQTATTDRGKEFACYANLESAHDVQVYFADLFSSWQRGSNENANGLLREFFPKETLPKLQMRI